MRILHSGHDSFGQGAFGPHSISHGSRDTARPGRSFVPLHGLRQTGAGGETRRGEKKMRTENGALEGVENLKTVHRSVRRVDGLALACGTAQFTDDVDIRGLLTGKILWSPHAHARIKKIDVSEARKIPGVRAVLTHRDVPRVPRTTAGQGYPEPSPYDSVVLDDKVRFVGDRVAAVAADSPEIADKALAAIRVDYEILPAVFDPLEAMRKGAPVIHDQPDSKHIADAQNNIACKFDFEVKQGEWFSGADAIID